MKTLKQMLKEIGYNDSPLRREVINTFKEWLQQKPSDYTVNYVDNAPPTHYLNKEKLLERL